MSDPSARKILLVGDVRGRLGALYKRVASVHASPSGPFEALFCVGPFFAAPAAAAPSSAAPAAADASASAAPPPPPAAADALAELRPYLDGTATAPVPTYFVDALPHGRDALRDPSGAVAPNITFVRAPSILEIAGLRVAVLPGHHDAMSYADDSKVAAVAAAAEGEYRPEDVARLVAAHRSAIANGAPPVDVLLTSEWPIGVDAFASANDDPNDPAGVAEASRRGSPVVAEVARELQPRYHVAGTAGVFYARQPYRNYGGGAHASNEGAARHATRFVGLGAVANPAKIKWMHALALVPATDLPPAALAQIPADATRSPYHLPPNVARGERATEGSAAAGATNDASFDHGSVRWEEPSAKRARIAASIDRRPIQGDVDKTVYVRNLAYRADEGSLAEFFGQCGELRDVRVGRDENGRSRGFCHVAFTTVEAAKKALELTETSFFGRDIAVQMAKSEEERTREREERRARDRDAGRGGGLGGGPGGNGGPTAAPTGCWFCLSNEKDTHLVASIANESFASMDKGGLVADHCQVVPVEHVPSFASMPPGTAEEVWRYVDAIRRCFADGGGGAPEPLGEDGKAATPRDLVVFERHLALRSKGGNHCHMNCVPVPRARASKARKIFEQAAKRLGFEWDRVDPPGSAAECQAKLAAIAGDGEYYCVHLPDRSMLVRRIERGERHWMSFGREVMGHLLGCPERAGWQQCMESEAAETARAEAFKKSFEPYDVCMTQEEGGGGE